MLCEHRSYLSLKAAPIILTQFEYLKLFIAMEYLFVKKESKADKHNATNPAIEIRSYPNNMNDYKVSFRGSDEEVAKSQRVPLNKHSATRVALWYPLEFREHSFPKSCTFLRSALKLKNEVVQQTWTKNGPRVTEPLMYTGVLGTAFLCFKAYQTTGSTEDLTLCTEIVDSCFAAASTVPQPMLDLALFSRRRPDKTPVKLFFNTLSSFAHVGEARNITFLCGQPGIYALGAVAATFRKDPAGRDFFLAHFNQVGSQRILSVGPAEEGGGMTYELLNGRVGYLYATLFINHYIGLETVPWSSTGPIVDAVLAAGRANSRYLSSKSPLMYSWKSTRYWGAAHGLAGILQILMHFPLKQQDIDDVKGTLRYMIKGRYLRGNYRASEGNNRGDRLVHWCHGAPGVVMTLCRAVQVFPEEKDFREAAVAAGDVVWERGLLRRLGLCHGISGNAYVFLSLYRIIGGKQHLFRARQFAGWVHKHAKRLISTGEMHGGDHPYSLFEGLAGTACCWLDVARPDNSRFPGYEI